MRKSLRMLALQHLDVHCSMLTQKVMGVESGHCACVFVALAALLARTAA